MSVSKLNKEIKELEEKKRWLEQVIRADELRFVEVKKQADDIDSVRKAKEVLLKEVEDSVAEINSNKFEMEKTIGDYQMDILKCKGDIETLRNDVAAKMKTNKHYDDEKEDLNTKIKEFEAKRHNLDLDIKQMTTDRMNLSEEVDTQKRELEGINKNIEDKKEELNNFLKESGEQIKTMEEELKEQKRITGNKIVESKLEMTDVGAELNDLLEAKKKMITEQDKREKNLAKLSQEYKRTEDKKTDVLIKFQSDIDLLKGNKEELIRNIKTLKADKAKLEMYGK